MAKERESLQSDGLRLQVYLAQCGLGSRRGCEKIIEQGRVQINGTLIRKQGVRVFPGDSVRIDGRVLNREKNMIYIALHKPPGYLCSQHDPEGRPLAIELIQPFINYRLFHVGRLDFPSSGLIFYTNDGEFSKKVAHPSSGIEKEYLVTSKEEIPDFVLEKFQQGIHLDGEYLKANSFKRISEQAVHLILKEGKNREIRRVFETFSIPVKKLHRVRIGNVLLKGIEPGHFRKLTIKEVDSLLGEALR